MNPFKHPDNRSHPVQNPIQELVMDRFPCGQRLEDFLRCFRAYTLPLHQHHEISALLEKPMQRFGMFGLEPANKIIGVIY